MDERVTRGVPDWARAGAVLFAFALAPAALAQSQDCARLQAQIARLGGGGRALQLEQAAQKQRSEIDRTEAYARSVGCQNRQFLFFGSPPPPQCGAIEAQLQRMRANFAQLLAELERSGAAAADSQRRDLIGRYNSTCAAGPPRAVAPQPRGLDSVFAAPLDEASPMQQVPLDEPATGLDDGQSSRGGAKAVCVRLADGGFFPVSYTAQRDSLVDLEDLCRALCPNTEVRLFTYTMSGNIEDAVGIGGESYASLPNALRYEKVYDPAASCKPPGQTWQQALAEAEQRLGSSGRSDILVTQEKSDELSRPRPELKPKAEARTPKGRSQPPTAAPKPSEDASALEAAAAAQVPTASQDSSGISAGDGSGGALIGAQQGETREITGPDGVKRKIRIVGPPP